MLNYEHSKKSFPPAFLTEPRDAAGYSDRIYAASDGTRLYGCWATMILPYLEEQALYDSFVFQRPDGRQQTLTTDNLSATALGSSGKAPNANLIARTTELAVMLCPSDDGRGRPYNGPSGV